MIIKLKEQKKIINKFNKMKKYIEDLKMKSIKENKLIYKNNIDNNYKEYYIKYLENKYIIKNFLYLIFIFSIKKSRNLSHSFKNFFL